MVDSKHCIHVIDDDEPVRDSLSFLLTAANFQVETYSSAKAFLRVANRLDNGCVITDVRMPEMSGIDLLRNLNERRIKLPVIVITGHGDLQLAVEAMKIGAADFLEKPYEDEILLTSVHTVLRRQQQENEQKSVLVDLRNRVAMLSGREREVLEGLVAGKPNKVIAYDLQISPRTVEVYRSNVMTKMHAKTLSELVRMALQLDILPKGESADQARG